MPAAGGASRKVYGARKNLEMRRSVLPSTARAFARSALDAARRKGRRRIASRLSTYRGPVPEVVAGACDDEVDLRWWPAGEISSVMWERRVADKVQPLRRWARARTRHLPQDERLDALRAVLPDDLIGRHARSHLAWCADLRSSRAPRAWFDRYRSLAASPPDLVGQLGDLVRAALEDGRHRALNGWLKRQTHPGLDISGRRVVSAVPLLAGARDVEEFCRAIASDAELAEALSGFLRAQERGVTRAAPQTAPLGAPESLEGPW